MLSRPDVLVLGGGGVLGEAWMMGVLAGIEDATGFDLRRCEYFVGTSAGAIVAALLAADYKADEIRAELERLDYNRFKDEGLLDKLGVIGKGMSIGFEYGIYEGEYFESWLDGLLRAKGKSVFGDIAMPGETDERYRYRLQVVASDITDRRLLVLPRDLKDLGYDPDQFSLSRAVRMSMSIPLFFEPVRLRDGSGRLHFIVDGGVLSNYPVWLLDDGKKNPPWPTFGFKLIEPDKRALKGPDRNPINNPVSFLKAIVGTMMDAHDKLHISRTTGDFARTIMIPTMISLGSREKEIKTTDFDITREESAALFGNGQKAAREFLGGWDFEKWKTEFRSGLP